MKRGLIPAFLRWSTGAALILAATCPKGAALAQTTMEQAPASSAGQARPLSGDAQKGATPLPDAPEESKAPPKKLPDPACCVPDHVYVRGEYLLWFLKPSPLATPIATFHAGDVAPILGTPGTSVILGGSDQSYGPSSGARFQIGGWLDEHQTWAFEAGYMYLGINTITKLVGDSGQPRSGSVGVPFFNPTPVGCTGVGDAMVCNPSTVIHGIVPNSESVVPVAFPTSGQPISAGSPELFPSSTQGGIGLSLQARMQGAEALIRWAPHREGSLQYSLFGGFRFVELEETLTIDAVGFTFDPAVSSTIQPRATFSDRTKTSNNFYGVDFGVRSEYSWHNVYLATMARLAMGVMHEQADLSGSTTETTNLRPLGTLPGGIFNQVSNIGRYSSEQFAVVPEINLTIGYQVTQRLSLFMGYSYLFVSDVFRPGDQIDRVVNPTQNSTLSTSSLGRDPNTGGLVNTTLVGAARPTFLGKETEFWTHGLNFGLQLSF